MVMKKSIKRRNRVPFIVRMQCVLDIPGYAPIEAPLPEDMQSTCGAVKVTRRRRIKPFPFHFGRGDKAMTFFLY